MNKKIHRFDKWSEFIDNAINGKHNPIIEQSYCRSRQDEWSQSTPWSGAHSFEEALEYLRKGWQDGIQRLKEFQKTIPNDLFDCIMPIRDYKPEQRHMISGGGLDVAAHLSGATPETFIGEIIQHDEGSQIVQGRKLQTVYYNITNSSMMNEAAFFYRGAYTFSMIEHLENCGYSVELWAVNYVTGGPIHQQVFVKVKEFSELFDLNKLAISLCSAFMLRRFVFSIVEQGDNDEIKYIQQKSYGIPVNNALLHDVALPEDMDLNPIWISTVNQSDPQQMLKEFRRLLDLHVNQQTIQE